MPWKVKVMMPDLAEIELERAFQHGIDRHDQRLDHIVQHVADADRGEHGDHGAFAAVGRARAATAVPSCRRDGWVS